jgi:hypothetical protein
MIDREIFAMKNLLKFGVALGLGAIYSGGACAQTRLGDVWVTGVYYYSSFRGGLGSFGGDSTSASNNLPTSDYHLECTLAKSGIIYKSASELSGCYMEVCSNLKLYGGWPEGCDGDHAPDADQVRASAPRSPQVTNLLTRMWLGTSLPECTSGNENNGAYLCAISHPGIGAAYDALDSCVYLAGNTIEGCLFDFTSDIYDVCRTFPESSEDRRDCVAGVSYVGGSLLYQGFQVPGWANVDLTAVSINGPFGSGAGLGIEIPVQAIMDAMGYNEGRWMQGRISALAAARDCKIAHEKWDAFGCGAALDGSGPIVWAKPNSDGY